MNGFNLVIFQYTEIMTLVVIGNENNTTCFFNRKRFGNILCSVIALIEHFLFTQLRTPAIVARTRKHL